jgi:CheY-like chemotaxis protein
MSSENPLQPEPQVFDLSGLQLLIVEADQNARLLYTYLFEDYGAQVLTAASIAEVFEVLQFQQPHLIISEICLPDKDGNRLIHEVQQLSTLQGQIPIISITASTNKNEQKMSCLSQFQKCLTQPMSLYKLVSLVARLTECKTSALKLRQMK